MAVENRGCRPRGWPPDDSGGSRPRPRCALGRNSQPPGRSAALGRRRSDPEGGAHELPLERHRGRCRTGRHACHARHGPVRGDRPARPAATPLGATVSGLLPSRTAAGRPRARSSPNRRARQASEVCAIPGRPPPPSGAGSVSNSAPSLEFSLGSLAVIPGTKAYRPVSAQNRNEESQFTSQISIV